MELKEFFLHPQQIYDTPKKAGKKSGKLEKNEVSHYFFTAANVRKFCHLLFTAPLGHSVA
jgi:hypothetical protein